MQGNCPDGTRIITQLHSCNSLRLILYMYRMMIYSIHLNQPIILMDESRDVTVAVLDVL